MAAGELVSVRAQQEMAEREVQVERQELTSDPKGERIELAGMYRAQGLSADDADTVARILSANPDVALDTHARLELGIDPQAPSSAWRAAVSSFVSFSVGAILPLFPWFFSCGLGCGHRLGDHRRNRGARARSRDRRHGRTQRGRDRPAPANGRRDSRRRDLRSRLPPRRLDNLTAAAPYPLIASRQAIDSESC
jgi:hypothetical protein